MKKFRPFIFFLALCASFALLLFIMFRLDAAPAYKNTKLSVVLYGDSELRWQSFDQGLRQACAELGIEKPALILVPQDDAERQFSLMHRELENGAQGLLVATANSELLSERMADFSALPLVLVETGAEGYEPICASNTQMGYSLAEAVAQDGHTSVTALSISGNRQGITQRYAAFLQRCTELGVSATSYITQPEGIETLLASDTPEAIVALDNETLEIIIDKAPKAPRAKKLYGVGSSNKVVHALDAGVLQAICYQNEFNIGYVGMMKLAAALGYAVPDISHEIDFEIVRRDNLYTPYIQRLVFPILQ